MCLIQEQQYHSILFKKNMKLVSIIVPVYNKEKYIENCITSILNQTYSDLELILVNDCSTDNSFNICKTFAEIDKRIILVDLAENGGPGHARNEGITISKGEYIQFVDADDELDPHMTEKLVRNIGNTDLVVCGYRIDDTEFNKSSSVFEKAGIYNRDDYLRLIFKWRTDAFIGSPDNKLYKKTILKQNSLKFPENQRWGEDLLFNLRYYERVDQISIIDEALYFVKRGINSLSTKNDNCLQIEEACFAREQVALECKNIWKLNDERNFLPQESVLHLIRISSYSNNVEILVNLIRHLQKNSILNEYIMANPSCYLNQSEKLRLGFLKHNDIRVYALCERGRAHIMKSVKWIMKVR